MVCARNPLSSRYGVLAWTTRVPRYLLPIYSSSGLLLAWTLPGRRGRTRDGPLLVRREDLGRVHAGERSLAGQRLP